MKHISELMTTLKENISKKKFYQNNQDKFLRYFDLANQYQALQSFIILENKLMDHISTQRL